MDPMEIMMEMTGFRLGLKTEQGGTLYSSRPGYNVSRRTSSPILLTDLADSQLAAHSSSQFARGVT
jgi:hypothetical protein